MLRVGLVGTFPPTKCGIATFTASVVRALTARGCGCGVVACVEQEDRVEFGDEVVARLVAGSPRSLREAADALDGFDVALVQHEFGIFGGPHGAEVLDLLARLHVPAVVVLHTVVRGPGEAERAIVEEMARRAAALVVLSDVARTRLLEHYAVDGRKVHRIPHGAGPAPCGVERAADTQPLVLTWGLLGRDKGIEYGIEAITRLADLDPQPRYVIAGQTHPKVREAMGEQYRQSLVERAAALGVAHLVEFDDRYCDSAAVLARAAAADVVLLPYRSREQVVSGVLVEAIASGTPVVATRFPHAEEMLAGGAGLLVPHEDADATAHALRRLLVEEELAATAAALARKEARLLSWERVGASYQELLEDVVRPQRGRSAVRLLPPPRYDHLLRLSDGVGVFEHAKLSTPRPEHGYCTDDVARALVAVMRERRRSAALESLAETCLTFLERAQLPDGRFHNRLSVDGTWLDEHGPDDATGRALWAAGSAAAAATHPEERWRALRLFERGHEFRTVWPRAGAFAVLGAVEALSLGGEAAAQARTLLEASVVPLGTVPRDGSWGWPEPRLTYANAVLAEARVAAGVSLGDPALVTEGLELLSWLVAVETRGDHFSLTPAGGWGPGEPRPGFDQQPIEAAALVDACARAFDVTGDPAWRAHALRAVAWFLGLNDVGVPLLDPVTGGCRDGLERDGVNLNQGAESTIAAVTALQQGRRLAESFQATARRDASRGAVSAVAAPTQRSAAP